MSNNFEYNRWLKHTSHNIEVQDWAFFDEDNTIWHKEVRVVCHECEETVEVWEFISEYEETNV